MLSTLDDATKFVRGPGRWRLYCSDTVVVCKRAGAFDQDFSNSQRICVLLDRKKTTQKYIQRSRDSGQTLLPKDVIQNEHRAVRSL